MDDYLKMVTRFRGNDLKSIQLVEPPMAYTDRVRSAILLDAPICRKGVLSDFNQRTYTLSYRWGALTDSQDLVLLVYKRTPLLMRILSLGFYTKELVYVRPKLYWLVTEHQSDVVVFK
ncbi:hypothetical protein KGO95_01290 [Patescibacteria group bacterium]|nr:hypothetical protein [Patescibacteria group bacterium]